MWCSWLGTAGYEVEFIPKVTGLVHRSETFHVDAGRLQTPVLRDQAELMRIAVGIIENLEDVPATEPPIERMSLSWNAQSVSFRNGSRRV